MRTLIREILPRAAGIMVAVILWWLAFVAIPCSFGQLGQQQMWWLLAEDHGISAGGGGPSFLVNQDFEGTGYDNGETWTEGGGGAVDEDFVTTVKVGSQALDVVGAGFTEITISDANTFTLDAWFYSPSALPSTTDTLLGIRTSAAAAVALVRINSSGALAIFTGGSDSTFTTDTISLNTWYRVRLIWNDGGASSVEFNTAGTFDGSGTDFQSKTGGTTADATRLRLGHTSTLRQYYFDLVQLQ